VGSHKLEAGSSPLVRMAFSIPVFCFRNNISRPTYHRLRAEGRGPVEMRIGLNIIRITAAAELAWQRQMQEPREDLEALNTERAVKAGSAAARSKNHISRRRRGRRAAVAPPSTARKGAPLAEAK
jgi:hypothetical protein